MSLRDIEWRPAGSTDTRILELQIAPLVDQNNGLLGISAAFLDVTVSHQLRADLERANQEMETAFEELQSAHEELETTNEELQSTVEELETMNEELQSTNEEQRTLNDQLHQRSEELDLVNLHLRAILGSLRAAVVVLNAEARIEIWSDKAQELWGLRTEEVVGQSFLDLDIGISVRELRQPILDCLNDGHRAQEMLIQGVNRRERAFSCRMPRRPTRAVLPISCRRSRSCSRSWR